MELYKTLQIIGAIATQAETKRMIFNGGVIVDRHVITDPMHDITDGEHHIQVGKNRKYTVQVTKEDQSTRILATMEGG